MARKLEVRYSVEYAVTIEVDDGESVSDVVSDIDIPESPLDGIGCSKYVSQTFEPQSVRDAETGEDVDWETDEDDDDEEDSDEDDRRDEKRGLYPQHEDDAN